MLQTEYFPLSIFIDAFFEWITELSIAETVVYFVQPQCIESAVNSCITICHKFPQLQEKWPETCTRKLNVRLKRSRLANYSPGLLPSKMNVFKTSAKSFYLFTSRTLFLICFGNPVIKCSSSSSWLSINLTYK